MKPKSIKRTGTRDLTVEWGNGHQSTYSFELLRDSCPCAGCSGESVLLYEYLPPEPDRSTPGRYEINGIDLIGSYAMQIAWGDGHNTGIYTWEYLLSRCPCDQHQNSEGKPQ